MRIFQLRKEERKERKEGNERERKEREEGNEREGGKKKEREGSKKET